MSNPSNCEGNERLGSNPQINRSRLLLLFCGITSCASPQIDTSISTPKEVVQSASVAVTVSQRAVERVFQLEPTIEVAPEVREEKRNCRPDMVDVKGEYCVDRYEGHLVDTDEGKLFSPYYTPNPQAGKKQHNRWFYKQGKTNMKIDLLTKLPPVEEWQFTDDYGLLAKSEPGELPSGYITKTQAVEACDNAGKRLCTTDEWITACQGEDKTVHPYGNRFKYGECNIHNPYHPSLVLTGNAGTNHDDPRLNTLSYKGVPLLKPTGSKPACISKWGDDGIYDMEGNLSEWIASSGRGFRGGAYFRSGELGCNMSHGSHSVEYYDYSIGIRCCSDTEPKVQDTNTCEVRKSVRYCR